MRGKLILRALTAGLLFIGALAFGPLATPVIAAETVHNTPVTLSGTSAQQTIAHIEGFCDECFPDDFFSCGGCEVAGGGKADIKTSVSWTAPMSVDTSVDPDKLHQGSSTNVTDTLTPGEGTISIKYTVPYQVGLFGRNGDFPAGPGWTPTSEYTVIDTFEASTSAPCTPHIGGDGSGTCTVSDVINVLPETCFFAGCPVDITVNLHITHTFTIGESGIVAHRMTTYLPDTDLNFASSHTVVDPLTIPCTAHVGDDVKYGLSGFTTTMPVSVTGSASLEFDIDGPGPANADPYIDIASGNVFAGSVPMSGSPATNDTLGTVLADNVAPTVNSIIQAGTYVEGSNVGFSAGVTDNCPTGLTYKWDFSDGGVAYGNDAYHAFADNGNGYTGRLTVTDLAGNATVVDFNVHAITNADPNATTIPGAAGDWGVPLTFHADAVDPGPADQPTLQFGWTFGDGATAAGQDVTHTYAAPGTFPVQVKVTDKDGGFGTADFNTVISKRDSSLVYTGATNGLPNKYVTLSATLSDEYGQPVVNKPVVFTLGSQTVTGYTNSSGVASVSLKLAQKPGSYPLSASYAGDSKYNPSATPSLTFTIKK